MKTTFFLNGAEVQAEASAGTTLLDYLRKLGLMGAKHGCESGECGACTVLIDNLAVNSCMETG